LTNTFIIHTIIIIIIIIIIINLLAWGSTPGGGEIFRIPPDLPWGPPSLSYNKHRDSLLTVMRPEA
jgi:hypothetical protein